MGQAFNIAVVWIGDKLENTNLPQSIKEHQLCADGSEYTPDFVITDSEEPEPINLIEYCTNIANVEGTFVTCIQADWHTVDWLDKDSAKKEHMSDAYCAAIFKELLLESREGRKRLTLFKDCDPSAILESLTRKIE